MSESSPNRARQWMSTRALPQFRVASWFTPAVAMDWTASLVVYAIARWLGRRTPFQQPIKPFIGDPTLQYAHVPDADQTVTGEANTWLTLMLPLAIALLIATIRKSFKDAHTAALGFIAGTSINGLVTNFIKCYVGRFRPDFFDRCQYDTGLEACTGIPAVINEGRRSFPSGHSSGAFFGCVFLMLYLAGKNRFFTNSATWPSSGILFSRILRMGLSIWPVFLAMYVAISRWEDHWHHPTDIIAGSIIGTLVALIVYHVYYPSPFVSSNFETMEHPRRLHKELEDEQESGSDSQSDRYALLGDERV